MDQQASFPYDQLHSLSFTQLFSLVVAMARWNWILHRNESLVLLRIREGERMCRLQPAYGALLLSEHGFVASERATGPGQIIRALDEAW